MSEASYQAMHSVAAFGSHTCHQTGTYLYIIHFKPLPPCCAVFGSHTHVDLFPSRQTQTLLAIYKYTLETLFLSISLATINTRPLFSRHCGCQSSISLASGGLRLSYQLTSPLQLKCSAAVNWTSFKLPLGSGKVDLHTTVAIVVCGQFYYPTACMCVLIDLLSADRMAGTMLHSLIYLLPTLCGEVRPAGGQGLGHFLDHSGVSYWKALQSSLRLPLQKIISAICENWLCLSFFLFLKYVSS